MKEHALEQDAVGGGLSPSLFSTEVPANVIIVLMAAVQAPRHR